MRLRVLRKDAASECLDMKKQSIIVLEYILELDKQERSSNECLLETCYVIRLWRSPFMMEQTVPRWTSKERKDIHQRGSVKYKK